MTSFPGRVLQLSPRSEEPELIHRRCHEYPPLHWAVIDHHVEVAKLLLERGADVNQNVAGLRREHDLA